MSGGNEKGGTRRKFDLLEDHCGGQLVYPDLSTRKGRRGRIGGGRVKRQHGLWSHTDLGFISESTFT